MASKKPASMKKILLLVIVSVLSFSSISGQAALIVLILGDRVATEQFHLSIDAGLNISTFNGLEEMKRGFGPNFGLGTHIKLSEKWYLKPEFKPLSRKGVREVASITEIPSDFGETENKYKLNYIDVPVLLQLYLTKNFFVSAGPQISFLTSANQFSYGTLTNGTESTIKISVQSAFKSVDFSLPVEAGWTVNLANKGSTTTMTINLFARYEYGFVQIFKDTGVGSANISLLQVGGSLPFIKTPEELAKNKKK
jgi:hypothetical protein